MNNRKKWVRGALCVGAAAGLLLLLTQLISEKPSDAGPHTDTRALSAPGQGATHAQAPLAPQGPWFGEPSAGGMPAAGSPLSTMTPPRFAADSRGRLVLDGATHANLEKLLLEEDPVAMRATLEQVAKGLPAQAAADLKVLVSQFEQYTKALSHSVSPENAPQTEQEGLKLLDSLHTLRVSYLGPETTEAMFGEEEATTRQIIALMGADKDPNLSQEEKAARAQEIISKRLQTAPPAS